MSKKASDFQKRVMSLGYSLHKGWHDDYDWCGYSYDRLAERMKWLDIEPYSVEHILITHQDMDHVGAVERDSDGLFRNGQ